MTEQQIDPRERELDSWMARAYEAEKRAWKAEQRLAGWMEHWNATARTGAVDEVAAVLDANTRADQAELDRDNARRRLRETEALLDQAGHERDEARAERDHFHEVAATFRDKFNAAERRADEAEARIAEEKRLRMKATAAATEAEARFQAVEDVLAAWHVEPGESGLADDLLRALNT